MAVEIDGTKDVFLLQPVNSKSAQSLSGSTQGADFCFVILPGNGRRLFVLSSAAWTDLGCCRDVFHFVLLEAIKASSKKAESNPKSR